MEAPIDNLLALGDLARTVKLPTYSVKYLVGAYQIQPVGRIGAARVWTREAIPKLEDAIQQAKANMRRTESSADQKARA
jgi:hypothetical protein